jgi:mRNA-degrading endonuclease RelE of RelBE toxin-antitoxin system
MRCKVILTDFFKKDAKKLAKKHRSLGNDLKLLIAELEENPYLGDRLDAQSYKIRIAIKSKGRGKSGGGRVITYVNISVEDNVNNDEVNVYLVAIYDKSSIESIPQHTIDAKIKEFLVDEEE